MNTWNKNDGPVHLDELENRVCCGGLDLASTTDITAFVLVFPPYGDDDKYTVAPWFWIPEDNLKLRVARDHAPTTCGRVKDSLRRPRTTWCTTGISRSSLRILAPGLISERSLSTGGGDPNEPKP